MFKLNIARTYPCPVSVTVVGEDGTDVTGKFTAVFKVLPRQKDVPANLLDHILVGLEGIELTGEDGAVLAGDAALDAAKTDPAVSMALLTAYTESVLKKNPPAN